MNEKNCTKTFGMLSYYVLCFAGDNLTWQCPTWYTWHYPISVFFFMSEGVFMQQLSEEVISSYNSVSRKKLRINPNSFSHSIRPSDTQLSTKSRIVHVQIRLRYSRIKSESRATNKYWISTHNIKMSKLIPSWQSTKLGKWPLPVEVLGSPKRPAAFSASHDIKLRQIGI